MWLNFEHNQVLLKSSLEVVKWLGNLWYADIILLEFLTSRFLYWKDAVNIINQWTHPEVVTSGYIKHSCFLSFLRTSILFLFYFVPFPLHQRYRISHSGRHLKMWPGKLLKLFSVNFRVYFKITNNWMVINMADILLLKCC